MAQTITGCVNWPEGTITFEAVGCVTAMTEGCLIWEGVHAGMVRVIITDADLAWCDGLVVYGCVDWTTGRFKIKIPNCCVPLEDITDPCDSSYECAGCIGFDIPTPGLNEVLVNFYDITICDGCINASDGLGASHDVTALEINDMWFLLEQSGWSPTSYNCWWITSIPDYLYITNYVGANCTGNITTEGSVDGTVSVNLTPGGTLSANSLAGPQWPLTHGSISYFHGSISPEEKTACVEGLISGTGEACVHTTRGIFGKAAVYQLCGH